MTAPTPLWRLALIVSAVLAANGGRLHPEADAAEPLRTELAIMTASPTWTTSHLLLLASVVLLAWGLWAARDLAAFGRARAALQLAVIGVSAYVLEAAAHLAAVVDSDALAAGEPAPVAFTHVILAVGLYPLSCAAIAWLSLRLARTWTGLRRLVVVPGLLGGDVHAASVPATLLLPDVELSPLFAAAGMLIALWALALGVLMPRRLGATTPAPVAPPPAPAAA